MPFIAVMNSSLYFFTNSMIGPILNFVIKSSIRLLFAELNQDVLQSCTQARSFGNTFFNTTIGHPIAGHRLLQQLELQIRPLALAGVDALFHASVNIFFCDTTTFTVPLN